MHLPDLVAMKADPADPGSFETVSTINVALKDPAGAPAFATSVAARVPGAVARPTSAPDNRTSTFVVLERFHLAIAIVTVIGSAVFLLALMVMLVDERRGTVGILRLIGLTRRTHPAPGLRRRRADRGGRRGVRRPVRAGLAGRVQPVLPVALRHRRWSSCGSRRTSCCSRSSIAIPLGILASLVALVDAAAPRAAGARFAADDRSCRRPTDADAFLAHPDPRSRRASALAILGVAAVGALLFDMLLLSRGLVLSFRDLLDRAGFDIRVLATDAPPFSGPLLTDATALSQALGRLPEVDSVLQLRLRDAELANPTTAATAKARRSRRRQPAWPGRRSAVHRRRSAGPTMWTMVPARICRARRRRDARAGRSTGNIARRDRPRAPAVPSSRFAAPAGPPRCRRSRFTRRPASCDFPFDDATSTTVAGTLRDAATLCGGERIATKRRCCWSVRVPASARTRPRRRFTPLRPGLHVVTNDRSGGAVQPRSSSRYFRQISAVLSTMTLVFAFLLIATLLTVSVNQRLGEIAALRALGLSAAADHAANLLWESALLRRRRRRRWRCRVGGCWRCGSIASCARCPASRRGCTSSSSSRARVVAARGAAGVTGAAAAAVSDLARATLPIAATLRREVAVVTRRSSRPSKARLTRSFPMPAGPVTALRDVSIRDRRRATTSAITGPSGCGKSTLLHLLGCVDHADERRVLISKGATSARCRMRSAAGCG